MTPFGFQIRRIRLLRGIEQRDLAARLCVRQSWLSDVELGNCAPPGGAFVDQLARVLDLSPADYESLRDSMDVSRRSIRLGPEFDAEQIEFVNLAFLVANKIEREELAHIMDILRSRLKGSASVSPPALALANPDPERAYRKERSM